MSTENAPPIDIEKTAATAHGELLAPNSPARSIVDQDAEAKAGSWNRHHVTQRLLTMGVEARGIFPVPLEQRIDKQYSKIFFIWFSANFNILSFSAGTLGPVVYGLGLRDSCLVILFFNLLCCAMPGYLTTWGPKLGLRQMCQARYSFGYWGVMVPSFFNLVTMTGFMILNCILGGQTLSSVTNGTLTWNVGIVVIALISLFISFCGYRVLNLYERLAWIPVLIVFLVAIGLGAHHLSAPAPAAPATPSSILSFASTIAGFVLTYSSLSSDFTTYLHHDVPSWKIFMYSYLGLLLPITSIQCLGAAFATALPAVPSWSAAYGDGNIGALLEAVLAPAGGFGKFLTVLLALSVTANIAPTIYSFCLSFQVSAPMFAHVPRYVFSVFATAIIIALSIVGAHRFYDTLTNFLGLIGYWASAFVAVITLEHFVFRQPTTNPPAFPTGGAPSRFASYDLSAWNVAARLPWGVAALAACVASIGLIVPGMNQVWFVGPFAKAGTGDIGFELSFFTAGICYVPFRWIEQRYTGR